MSFAPGELTTTDLSANANIQGTQIADKTLLFRNFSEDVFKIVKSGSISNTAVSITSPGTGNYQSGFSRTTLPHGLGYSPAILGYVNYTGTYQPLPYTSVTGGSTTCVWITVQILVDNINIYLETYVTEAGGTGTYSIAAGLFPIKYYLLQETASAS